MHQKIVSAQDNFIENIGKLCDSFGMNRFIAQLYAVLYLSDKPLSLDEIVERLKVSKGNVSVNIRLLENMGAVRNVWVKGSRKDFYEANLDIKDIILRRARSAVEKRVHDSTDLVESFKGMVSSDDPNFTEEDRKAMKLYEERMKKIEELNSFASTALALMDKML